MKKENKVVRTVEKRGPFKGNMIVLALLVLLTFWSVIGLLIPLAYWFFSREKVIERVEE